MEMSGAAIIIKHLEEQGISVVCGIPGGASLPLYDALHGSSIRHILAKHEQAAGFMAQGMARRIRRPAVCLASSGPGVLNLLTALGDAKADGVPVIAITGQVSQSLQGTEAFQEVDTPGLARMLCKAVFAARRPEDLLEMVPEAFRVAMEGRHGPVLIDVPKDVQLARVVVEEWPGREPGAGGDGAGRDGAGRDGAGGDGLVVAGGSGGGAIPGASPAGGTSAPGGPGGGAGPGWGEAAGVSGGSCGGHAGGCAGLSGLDPMVLDRVCALIQSSRRPVLIAGAGLAASAYRGLAGGSGEAGWKSEAVDLLGILARRGQIPVALTLHGLGNFDPLDELYLGMAGMHGSEGTNLLLDEADLVLVLGARLDDRLTGRVEDFCPRACIIQVDIDPGRPGITVNPDLAVIADAGAFLAGILGRLPECRRPEWMARMWELKTGEGNKGAGAADMAGIPGETVPGLAESGEEPAISGSLCGLPAVSLPLAPDCLIRHLSRFLGPEAVVTTDVGQHQMWVAQHWPFHGPGQLLTSGGMGTMGFGLPAALGAALVEPGRPVVCVTGDGSLLMNVQELATLAELDLPVMIVVFNNGHLGLVRQQQELFFRQNHIASRFEHRLDLAAVARGFGILGVSINDEAELVEYLATSGGRPRGPVLLDVRVEETCNVFPMVAPGKANREMITGGAGGRTVTFSAS